MFTAQLTGHDLHAPDGTTIDGVCERSVRERVLDIIGHLDEQAALQSRIIRNALRMEPGMEDAHPTASVSSDTDAEHYPIELGTRIANAAILQETDGTVSWLTANRSDTMAADKTVDERYEPGAPTSGLYDGMAGTGMFAAELYRRTHDERWRDLCTRMMRSLMRRKDRGITYSGFTSGLSRSYCALRMANAGADGERFFEDESGRAFPDKADITALLGNADWDDDGVCHGRCGVIDTLISIGNANGDGWYRMQAQRLMDDMIAQARSSGRFRLRQSREFVDLSYFQGPVGVAYTMLRLNDPSTPSILALETR